MTAASPLPRRFLETPFSTAEALRAGVTPSRLRARDLEAPTRGVRRVVGADRDEDAEPADPHARRRSELLDRVRGIAPALTPDQFFSHGTGLAILGAPLPMTSAEGSAVHISARRPHAQPDRRGTTGHRLQKRAPAIWRVSSLPVEHPARLWRQAASSWSLDDLIAAADFLVCPRNGLLELDDLWREIDEAGDVRRGILTRALAEVRVGSESAPETHLRLALTRAGLPEPEVNWELRDARGRFIARLDLAYPGFRVAPEYDGRWHADVEQFAKDADRWDDIREQGWQHVRILSHHLRPDPRIAVRKVTDALVRAGWHPGRAG